MLDRLGNVLYWLATATAGIIVAGVVAVFYLSNTLTGSDQWVLAAMASFIALAIWIVGRAAKYVLSGR